VRVLYELFNENVALQGFEAQELNREINITPSSMVAETAHMNSSRIAEMRRIPTSAIVSLAGISTYPEEHHHLHPLSGRHQ